MALSGARFDRRLGAWLVSIAAQQVFSRLVPFFLNLGAKSALHPEDTALSSVTFQLLLAVSYGLGRDGIRRGCQRAPSPSAAWSTARALTPFSVLATCASAAAFLRLSPLDVHGQPQQRFQAAVGMYTCALIIEHLVEPFCTVEVYKGSAFLEFLAEVLARSADAVAVWVTIFVPQAAGPPAIAFARGHLAYALTLAATYLGHSAFVAARASHQQPDQGTSAGGRSPTEPSALRAAIRAYSSFWGADSTVMQTCVVLTWQGGQKMLLQEASRFALTGYSAYAAGVYGEVQNLGGFAARVAFMPVESAAYRVLSHARDDAHAPAPSHERHSAPQAPSSPRPSHEQPVEQGKKGSSAGGGSSSVELLMDLHRVVTVLAAVALAFAPGYAYTSIRVLLSERWAATDAPMLLTGYSVYLVFLAVNGVTEAYCHAHMSNSQLVRSNVFMMAVALGHALGLAASRRVAEDAVLLLGLDCCAMAVRCLYSFVYIGREHAGALGRLSQWLPQPGSLAVLAVAGGVGVAGDRWLRTALDAMPGVEARAPLPVVQHAAAGLGLLVAVVAALSRTERDLLVRMRGMLKAHAA